MIRIPVVVLVVLALCASVLAEGVPTTSPQVVVLPPSIDYGQAFGWLQPYVIAFASALVAAAGSWLVYIVQRFTGLKIDQTLSDTYIKNAQNQAGALIAKGFVKIKEDGKVQVDNPALAAAANDLLRAVPDAASRFDLKPHDVADKIVAMIPQVPAAAAATAPKIAG